jgi:RNA polymerase sigma-70 factor, ECF subfamily
LSGVVARIGSVVGGASAGDEGSRVTVAAAGVESFEAWYRGQYGHVVRVLTVAGGDREVAADAAAEAFTRALAHWDRVKVMSSPEGWVYTVALNVLRRRQQRARVERIGGQRPAAEPPVPGEYLDLWKAVQSLPPRQRTAVVLHYVADLTQGQAAEVMGVAPGTVAAMLHAARGRLRALLGSDEESKGAQ